MSLVFAQASTRCLLGADTQAEAKLLKCFQSELQMTFCAILIILLIFSSTNLFLVYAQDMLYTIDSQSYGKSYNYWTQKWWEWNLLFPKSLHPNVNFTSDKCGYGIDPNRPVVFLPQAFLDSDPTFDRTCTIPSGKAVLTAIQSGDCNYGAIDIRTENSLRECAMAGNDGTVITVSVDGNTYPHYEEGRRATSDLFNVTVIPGNIMEYQNLGVQKAIVDGYYIFLKPLSVGEHTVNIKFDTHNVNDATFNTGQEGIWHLIVK